MARGTRSAEHEGIQVQVRPTGKRHIPFFGSLLVAVVFLPVLFGISRLFYLWDQPTGVMIADGWLISGLVLAVFAIGVGLFHAKRTNFVIKHVSFTLAMVGLGGNLFTLLGFKHRVLSVPGAFLILIIWASWMLYRIDVFRAKATGESGDSWGDLVGLARSRPKNVKVTENQVTFDVEHGVGETHGDVVRGVTKLANAAGVITGRAQVVEGERGGVSHVAWSMADTFADWRNWPGPSHPGASFAYPFRTAWYEDGEDEWFSFTPTFAELSKSMVSDLVSPMGTFLGFAGITGSGKSGFLNNLVAEGLTRVDAEVVWVDAEKLRQNAGWALDMLAMAAGTPEQVNILTRGLRGLAEYRVELFGQAALDSILDPDAPLQGREWTPMLAQELRTPAVLVVCDEADTIIRTKLWEWLATRGRSLGIFLCVGGPRVSTAEVTALLRSAIGAWKTFGQGDAISGMFTLPDDVRETVDVQKLREQGLHYLTGAPGVERRRWSTLAREFRSDTRTLRQVVQAARARFEPMGFTEEEQRWLGDAWLKLRPEVLMGVRAAGPTRGNDDDDDPIPGVPEDPTRRADETPTEPVAGYNGDDPGDLEAGGKMAVRTSSSGTCVEDDELAAMDNSALDPETAAEAALVDPEVPFDTRVPDGEAPVGVRGTKPRVSEAEERRALDDVFRRFAEDPTKAEFGNKDILDALPCWMSPATMSRRLAALEGGERLMPPGLELERLEGGRLGRWRLNRTKPSPKPRG